MRKLTILMILVGLSSEGVIAQKANDPITQLESATVKIVEVIRKLSDEIDSFSSKVKAKKIHRELGYMQTDLEQYLIIRRIVTESLEAIDYDLSFKGKRREEHIDTFQELGIRMSRLHVRLWGIRQYVNAGLEKEIREASFEMRNIYAKQTRFIDQIIRNTEGGTIDKDALRKDGRQILVKLEESVFVIDSMTTILQRKFDF